MSGPLSSRVFTFADQQAFADASGDRNPMHLDPVEARRAAAGAPVVHGMHAVIWAIDVLAASGVSVDRATGLEIRFHRFMYVGSELTVAVLRRSETQVRAEIHADGAAATTIILEFASPSLSRADFIEGPSSPLPASPVELELSDVRTQHGAVEVASGDLGSRYGRIGSALGRDRVDSLAALSALVGMVCPGLHSIFIGAKLVFEEPAAKGSLDYVATKGDDRHRLVELAVATTGLFGTVKALVRQPPIEQPHVQSLRKQVSELEFKDVSALVVGGSRGLGALSAKLIAAGGGRVIISYRVGEREARDLAAEIGPQCAVLPYDAVGDADAQLAGLNWPVNQLLYFATPQIFQQKAEAYSRARFMAFYNVYVDGFLRTIRAASRHAPGGISVFYPSSVAVTDRPINMTEYAMAKAAGEILCEDIDRREKTIHIVVKRLPRLLTDQTASSVLEIPAADAVVELLPVLREMRDGAMASR